MRSSARSSLSLFYSLSLSFLLSHCSCSCSCCLRVCGLTTATDYGKNLSSSLNTSTRLISIFICIGICIMFTILRFGRHCSLINHYGIHMWFKRSLTAFQRIVLRFQVEGCSTDRDCVLRSLYMDLVHSLHFEFQSFMDAEEICVYYDYFLLCFFCFPSVFSSYLYPCPSFKVSVQRAQFAKVCHFWLVNTSNCAKLSHLHNFNDDCYRISSRLDIWHSAGSRAEHTKVWRDNHSRHCLLSHRYLSCLDRDETFNY